MVLDVKGGKNVGIDIVYDMRVVLEGETAQIAGLMNMDEMGDMKERNFAAEMAQAKDLDVHCVQHAWMQMMTVKDILDGEGFVTPLVAGGKGKAAPILPCL